MLNYLINKLYEKMEPHIDTQITGRIVIFHRALIERGQIKRPPKEVIEESPIAYCNRDYISQ